MKKRLPLFQFISTIVLCTLSSASLASETVWRYVDESTGKVIFSNVPLKGKKGERVQTYVHPPVVERKPQEVQTSSVAGAPKMPSEDVQMPTLTGNGSIIPESLLRQLGLDGKKMLPALPKSLPPLPQMAEQGTLQNSNGKAVPPATKEEPVPVQPTVPVKPPAPSWARPVEPSKGTAPAWAKDPFSQQ